MAIWRMRVACCYVIRMLHVSCPSHVRYFNVSCYSDCRNIIGPEVQGMKLFIMQFHTACSYVMQLTPSDVPQHSIFEEPQSVSFP